MILLRQIKYKQTSQKVYQPGEFSKSFESSIERYQLS